MRARHICTSFSEVNEAQSNAAFKSAIVAESRSIACGAGQTSSIESVASNSSLPEWEILFRILVSFTRNSVQVRAVCPIYRLIEGCKLRGLQRPDGRQLG